MKEKIWIFLTLFCHYAENCTDMRHLERSNNMKGFSDCDQHCIFPYRLVTSCTMTVFPVECSTVCADLFIDNNCDLTEKELEAKFRNMNRLVGDLSVYNTSFTSGRFLAGLESYDSSFTMVWNNNKELEELGLSNLSSVRWNGLSVDFSPKMKRINIPNLAVDYSSIDHNMYRAHPHIAFNYLMTNSCIPIDIAEEMLSFGALWIQTLYTYICNPTPEDNVCITPEKGCRRIFGDVVIGHEFDVSILKDVEIIIGTLTIRGSDVENLSFLENLKFLACKRWESSIFLGNDPVLIIENNNNLRDFTFPRLQRALVRSEPAFVFENNGIYLKEDFKKCQYFMNSLDYGTFRSKKTCDPTRVERIKIYIANHKFKIGWAFICVVIIVVMLTYVTCSVKKSKKIYDAEVKEVQLGI